jgi:hypothetical protein
VFEDGRYLIILNGLSRFKIIDEINNNKLYRECNVSFNEFKNDIDSKKEEIKFTDLELIFKDLKNLFLKRAEGNIHYICSEGKAIAAAVEETIRTGERVNLPVPVIATVPDKFGDEPVAEFIITLSMKEK